MVRFEVSDQYLVDAGKGLFARDIERKGYNCGKRHTAAYDTEVENRPGLGRFVGDWVFNGIQCAECHGPTTLARMPG